MSMYKLVCYHGLQSGPAKSKPGGIMNMIHFMPVHGYIYKSHSMDRHNTLGIWISFVILT